ncbi:EmrB/QacA subfamily drug resistance transporter [Paenibacillus castaneae]|uniref:DHA2 family efflux MFS transporter permease subunit n=1 Tax=Paenibacillus castaneae TaxID=474957 RepID=UPI000C9A2424|nr:DHA2 family efflux MFS transporter permease subunit [Paenibacillus castaneae]NIK78982.1 EmrB/QacA subfamily drug resistance transporter [Paenibacillus castaneae]
MEEQRSIAPTITVLICGMFIAILNQTMVNVAIPHMMNDLNVSTTTIQWLSTGFMLANAIMIPISAFLMETISTRLLFAAAMSLFTIGSLICGIGNIFSIILFGRIVQAIGAGIMMPLVTNIFLRIFPPEKMGRAMGMMGIAMMFAPAVGPTFAGYMVEHYSWRILFFVMVPLGVVEVLLTFKYLSNVLKLTYPKLDWLGAVFSTIGFGGLLYGLSEAGSKGWGDVIVLVTIIIGLVALIFFVFRQITISSPLLNLRVFSNFTFTMSTLVSMVVNMAMFGAMLLLPIYIQNIRGYTALESGLLLLPGALLMGIMSPISGMLFDRFGVRPLALVGLTITAITTYQFTKLTDSSAYMHVMLLYALRSFGVSFIMMTIMTEGLNALSPKLKGHGTAVSNTMRQVASSFGTALLVTVMSTRTTEHLVNYSNNLTLNNAIATETIGSFNAGITAMAGLPTEVGGAYAMSILGGLAAKESTIGGINDAFLVATYITIIGIVFSLFLNRPKKQ